MAWSSNSWTLVSLQDRRVTFIISDLLRAWMQNLLIELYDDPWSIFQLDMWEYPISDLPSGRGPACSSVRWGTPKNVYRPSRDDSISTHGHMCHMSDVWYTLLGLPQYLKYKRLSCALSGLDLWLHSWMVHIDLLGCAIHRRFQRAPLRGEGGNQGNHLNFWWRRDFKCRISGPRKGV